MKVIDANPWILDHIKLYQTDPEAAHMWDATVTGGPGPTPSLLLTTVGRKSGEPRYAPLIYQEVEGNYVVLASKGGMDTHPVWYLNLEANPNCHVQVSTLSTNAVAHTAHGAETDS